MVETATASVFHKFMSSGRTGPMLTTCALKNNEDVDVIVKLNGAMDFGSRAAGFELIGSLVASKLGIDSPSPYLVWLSSEFIEVVAQREPARASQLRASVGWNFGSEMLKDALIWPDETSIPSSMLPTALKVFCFDGLTQNPDRCTGNPNLFVRGDELTVFDHECAFSFLHSILPSSEPWMMGAGDYMERHALRGKLQRKALDWQACREALSELTASFFESIHYALPHQWDSEEDLAAIERHIASVLEHVDLFEAALQRKIA